MNAKTWLREILATWRAVLGDAGVLLMLLIAPLIYSFFYPWPYSTEQLQRVPVALVDQDHSGLSRQIQRFVQASPRLELRLLTGDEGQARAALEAGEIRGYALLPAGLKREAARGRGQVVPVLADGAYFLPNKIVLQGFAEVLGTASAGIELRQLQAGGQSPRQAQASRSPLNVELAALYNPHEGYGSAVVPAVAVLIIQQLLLIGVAMWVGHRFERPGPAEGIGPWSARLLALASLGGVGAAWFYGLIFPSSAMPMAATRPAPPWPWPCCSGPARPSAWPWAPCWPTASAPWPCCWPPPCPSPSWPASPGRARPCRRRCGGWARPYRPCPASRPCCA